MKIIFLSHPYKNDPDYLQHLKPYINYVWNGGNIPLAPHLLFPVFAKEETERDKIMQACFKLISVADECFFCGHKFSEGMTMELDEAKKMGKKIKMICLTDELEGQKGGVGWEI